MARALSALPIGSLVKDTGTLYNGKPIIWRIVDKNHSGYPSNSVTLITDKIITLKCFDAKEPNNSESNRSLYGNNRYFNSNLRQWLNSEATAGSWYSAKHSTDAPPNNDNVKDGYNDYNTEAGFLNGFSANMRNALLTTTITAEKAAIDGGGSDTFSNTIFIAGGAEIGLAGSGSILAWFNSVERRLAYPTAECVSVSEVKPNSLGVGTPWQYWIRDSPLGYSCYSRHINTSGEIYQFATYDGRMGVRPLCNISSLIFVSNSTDSDGCYTIIWNQAPTTPSSITVPTTVIGGQNLTVSWGSSTDSDGNLSGYILERKADSGAWTQVYKGSSRSATVSITYGWNSVQFRVKAYDSAGAESSYTTSATRTVTNNRTPVISGSNSNLGSFSETAPSYSYTVTDADGDTVTVVEALDGTTQRSYTVTLGSENTFTLSSEAWQKVLNGSHTLAIKATDSNGASATRTLTFTKAVTSISFEQTVAMPADDMPMKALLNIQGSFPAGSILKVEICNNGNDAEPTWEDVTTRVLNGQKCYFSNTQKTAESWGVKIRVHLSRGTATEPCYIQTLGGNFG